MYNSHMDFTATRTRLQTTHREGHHSNTKQFGKKLVQRNKQMATRQSQQSGHGRWQQRRNRQKTQIVHVSNWSPRHAADSNHLL